jgi:hypothetical protein
MNLDQMGVYLRVLRHVDSQVVFGLSVGRLSRQR